MSTEASSSRDRVAAALKTLRGRAAHPDAERLPEAATKSQFVEPLLHAMGYESLDDIEWEHHIKASGEYIDYVLKVAGNPVIAVEAKSFGTELVEKHAAQLVQYAAVVGIEWCVLTNGREIRLFNHRLKGGLAAQHVIDLDVLAEQPDDVLDVLSLLTKEGMANQDNLKQWMREAVLDRALRLELLDSHSATTVQLAETAREKTGLGLTSEDVSRWFARILASSPPPEVTKEPTGKKAEVAVSYWLLPAHSKVEGESSVEALKRWLDVNLWGMGRSTPGRQSMKEGDLVCFYATKVGIVASSEIAGSTDVLMTAGEWPEPTPMDHEVFKIPLRNTQWLPQAIPVDEALRSRLDAFRGKKSSSAWGWFVQSTSKLSERDFSLLIGQPLPQ